MIDVAVLGGPGHEARVTVAPGGSAANAAAWAAALGADATVVAAVGDDAAGRMLAAELETRGVRASLAVDADAPTGTFVRVDGSIWADRGANARFPAAHLAAPVDADAVLVSGYLPRPIAEQALALARARWIALDAGRLTDLPPGANTLLVNGEAAHRLTGREPEGAALALGERYQLVCVTRGEAGAVAVHDGALVSADSPAVAPVDTTGAGDAFAAGLLVALARGRPLAQALAEGCSCGARAAGTASPWPVLK